MGLEIGSFEKVNNDGHKELKSGALTIDRMSSNVIAVMNALARNETIFKLIYFEDDRPMNHDIKNPVTEEDKRARDIFINGSIRNVNSKENKISPLPFNPEAQTEDSVFIRVYYNQGNLTHGELVHNTQMHVDIICSKELWLIEDDVRELGLIRPYAIFSRVVEEVGNRNANNEIKIGNFVGFQHLSVNAKFECIRLYSDTMQLG